MPITDPVARREYVRRWVAARREEFFRDKVCVRCGSTDRLELDHIDEAKKVSHRIWSWSESRRLAEIEKCQVLCYPCHREKTAAHREPDHGTDSRYTSRCCRCGPCTEAHRQVKQAWRDARKAAGLPYT